eukprot:gene3303-25082_t
MHEEASEGRAAEMKSGGRRSREAGSSPSNTLQLCAGAGDDGGVAAGEAGSSPSCSPQLRSADSWPPCTGRWHAERHGRKWFLSRKEAQAEVHAADGNGVSPAEREKRLTAALRGCNCRRPAHVYGALVNHAAAEMTKIADAVRAQRVAQLGALAAKHGVDLELGEEGEQKKGQKEKQQQADAEAGADWKIKEKKK